MKNVYLVLFLSILNLNVFGAQETRHLTLVWHHNVVDAVLTREKWTPGDHFVFYNSLDNVLFEGIVVEDHTTPITCFNSKAVCLKDHTYITLPQSEIKPGTIFYIYENTPRRQLAYAVNPGQFRILGQNPPTS